MGTLSKLRRKKKIRKTDIEGVGMTLYSYSLLGIVLFLNKEMENEREKSKNKKIQKNDSAVYLFIHTEAI